MFFSFSKNVERGRVLMANRTQLSATSETLSYYIFQMSCFDFLCNFKLLGVPLAVTYKGRSKELSEPYSLKKGAV